MMKLFYVFALVAVCANALRCEAAEVKKGKEVEGYVLSIKTEKHEYSPSEKVVLNVAIKNVGSQDARIAETLPLRMFNIEVRNVSQKKTKKVPLTLLGQRQPDAIVTSRASVTLKPGDTYSAELHLNRLFDMTLPGKYEIAVSKKVWLRKGGKEKVAVSAPSLAVSILEE